MPSWPAGGEIGPAEHGRRDERLTRLAMPRLELAHDGDAVRAHDEMDRAFRQRFAEPARSERDLADGRVLDEHRDDDVAARRELGDGRRRVRARCGQRCGLRRELIEHPQIVARIEQATGHSLSHAAEADEPYFHVFPEQACAKRGGDFDALACALQAAERGTFNRLANARIRESTS